MRICPNCREPLQSASLNGIALDLCRKCAGIWFDAGELVKLKESSSTAWENTEDAVRPSVEAPPPNTAPSGRPCPACGKAMYRYAYLYTTTVMLDGCESCGGVWVDDKELDSMAGWASKEAAADNSKLDAQAEAQQAVAELDAGIAGNKLKAQRLTRVFNVFSSRIPYYW